MKTIDEIYWLRFYGAIAVFSFHLIDHVERNYLEHTALDLARIPFVLGTPIFVFISIFLFSARYENEVPQNFLTSRLKYVMLPYFIYGTIYATAVYFQHASQGEPIGYVQNLTEYLLFAGWHGYFLVVAMQFYVLFWAYKRFGLHHWMRSGPWLVPASLISIGWWGYCHWQGVEPPGYLHWIAPIGWIYLFFLALLVVRHYPDIRTHPWLRRLSDPTWLVLYVGALLILGLRGDLEYSSKEPWVIPLFILALAWALPRLSNLKATPAVKTINEASFGIYLAHPIFFSGVDVVGAHVAIPLWLYVIVMAVAGLGGSILLNQLVNRYDWSAMLLGRRLRVA